MIISAPDGNGTAQAQQEWQFSADKVVAENDSEYVQAYGNVTVRSGTSYIKADFARFYQATKWIYLKGNVKAQWKGDFYDAAEAEFDLNNMVGWLKKGRVFVAKPHVYFESEFIEKHNGATYSFKDAKVTACDGENPAWSFEAGEGDITLNGYARLWHSKFKIKGVPVAYTPYMSLPLDQKRQSGFLTPEVGSSKKMGTKINIPYYWAINEETDLTVYGEYLAKRGFRPGVDFRHTEDVNSKGQWRADWLYDGKTYDNAADSESVFKDEGMIRPNNNRWWIRSKYNGYVGSPDWQTIVDLDLVSDQDYLREFRSGANGYEASREGFLEEFGRDINPMDSDHRVSTALVAKSWDQFAVSGLVQYDEDLRYRNGNNPGDKNPALQKLPQLDAFAFKENLMGTPLEWEAEVSANYFWREFGMTGARFDVHPTLSMPVTAGGVTFIPRAGVRATSYLMDSYQNASSDIKRDSTQGRLIADAGITAFSEFFRVFDVGSDLVASKDNIGKSSWTKMKHNIVPRLEYNWVQDDPNQKELPYFDSRDRITKSNDITFSLTNVLDRSQSTVVAGKDGEAVLESEYLEFFRFRLEQGYDIDEAGRSADLGQYERRPFSDVMGEIILTPYNYVNLTSRTWVSPYLGDVTEHENILKIFNDSYGEILFGYDYLRKIDEYKRKQESDMQIVRYAAKAYLPWGLVVGGEYRADINNSKDLEKTVSLGWNHQCFFVEFLASKTTIDERYAVNFNLVDFGVF
ncbi:LPS-assembly protein LptD [Maridesulfovibrio ferrireducens]|uniref:LPS-assembly protein LptD n=1 Tax=Maridesulfovibrio ferrireducens TaxID=246191 RepID=UPI0026EF4BFB|nr:LPS assembly protein LptD [Maridesulfovibrio ferrireducens]